MHNDHLKQAISLGDIETIQYLLKLKPDSSQSQCASEGTPLHYACMKGDIDMVKIFIAHGFFVNISNGFGKIPLHYACIRGKADVVKTLI